MGLTPEANGHAAPTAARHVLALREPREPEDPDPDVWYPAEAPGCLAVALLALGAWGLLR